VNIMFHLCSLYLNFHVPLRELARGNGIVQVLGGVIRIRARQCGGLGGRQVVHALLAFEVEFAEDGHSIPVHL
jgi:hypothetical protein